MESQVWEQAVVFVDVEADAETEVGVEAEVEAEVEMEVEEVSRLPFFVSLISPSIR